MRAVKNPQSVAATYSMTKSNSRIQMDFFHTPRSIPAESGLGKSKIPYINYLIMNQVNHAKIGVLRCAAVFQKQGSDISNPFLFLS